VLILSLIKQKFLIHFSIYLISKDPYMLPFNVNVFFVPLNTIIRACHSQVGPIHIYMLIVIFRQTRLCGQPFN
jgi:hypothetical protein